MYNTYKKLTAQLLLFSFLLESCYNPHIGVSKKTLLTPKRATFQQHQYKENTCSKNLEPSTSFSCTTADGHAITFMYHNEVWQAEVCMPNGRRQLPVTFGPGYTIEGLINKDPTEQRQLIHICPNKDNNDPIDHIYIGKAEDNIQYINKIITKKHSQPAEASAQEQASLQTIPSPVQAIPASPNSQLRATYTPLPIPNSELFVYNNDHNKYNNAHKIPNKRTPSLKNQHALTHSQRAAQTKRAERIARNKPLDEPKPTAHLKQNTPPTTLPPSSAAKAPQDIDSPIFVSQGGQRVHFIYKNDQWQASVRERIGAFSRTEVLPVHCERHGDVAAALLALQGKPDKYVQQRIHVMTARRVPYVPKFVFIGEQGLKGGGDPEPSGSLVNAFFSASTLSGSLVNAFFNAIRDNNTARVTELLRQYSSLLEKIVARDNGYGAMRKHTPLMYAVQLGYTSMVSLLVERNAKVNQAAEDGVTPLMIAAHHGHQEVAKYLVGNGALVNQAAEDGTTPLYIAAGKGHLETAQYLVGQGPLVNQAQSQGATPLYIAAQEGHLETVEYLLAEHNAEVNQAGPLGATPLMIAAGKGHLEVVKYLLVEHNAEVNQAAKDGWTPLMLAAAQGHLEVVKYLVGNGAAINAIDNNGCTPLHRAAEYSHTKVVEYLIKESEIDVNAENKPGRTALHLMIQDDKEDITVSTDIQNIVFSLAIHAARADHKGAIEAFLAKKLNEVYKLAGMLLLLAEAVQGDQSDQREVIPLLMKVIDVKAALEKIAQEEGADANSNVFKVLLKQGVLPDEDMLRSAIINGSVKIVGLISEKSRKQDIDWDSCIQLAKDEAQRNKEEVEEVLRSYKYLYDSISDAEPACVQNRNFQKVLYCDHTILHLAAKTNKKILRLFWKANPGAFGVKNEDGESPLSLIQSKYMWALLWTIRGVKYPLRIMKDNSVVTGLVVAFVGFIYGPRFTNHLWPPSPIYTQPIYLNQTT